MPMQWNHEADAKLLVGILKVHNFSIDYQAIAKEMGPECTAKAITHRIAKLKSIAKGETAAGPGKASNPSTPRKPRAATKPGSAQGKRKKTPAKKNIDSDDEDDNDDEEQPIKPDDDYADTSAGADVSPSKKQRPSRSISAAPVSYVESPTDSENENGAVPQLIKSEPNDNEGAADVEDVDSDWGAGDLDV